MSNGPAPGLALFSWAAISVTWLGASTTVSLNGVPIASASQSAASVLPIGGVGMILTGGAAASWDDLSVTTSCSACVERVIGFLGVGWLARPLPSNAQEWR